MKRKVDRYLKESLGLEEDSLLYQYLSKNYEHFNFGSYMDFLASVHPDKLAMKHIDINGVERNFSYQDMSTLSSKAANYFTSLGIKKGDRVMITLRNTYQFYIIMLALEKIGAIAMPTHFMTKSEEYKYRIDKVKVKAFIGVDYGDIFDEFDKASLDADVIKIAVNKKSDNSYLDFDKEIEKMSDSYESTLNDITDVMAIYSTSGTTGHAKLVAHNYGFPLAHIITGRDWYGVDKNSLHYTPADSGWAMSSWNMFAIWMNQGAMFMMDYDRFDAEVLLESFSKYNITSICAPRVMWRLMLKAGMNNYDFSSLQKISSAGEEIDPDTREKVEQFTGLNINEGYGMTEVALAVYESGNDTNYSNLYKRVFLKKLKSGIGGITIKGGKLNNLGMFLGYVERVGSGNRLVLKKRQNPFETGDIGCIREGKFKCLGRANATIKTNDCLVPLSEVESVLMRSDCVKECLVYVDEDQISGTKLKAKIVLEDGYEPSDELAQFLIKFVGNTIEPYKKPKEIEFCDELPKTNNGKTIRISSNSGKKRKFLKIRN